VHSDTSNLITEINSMCCGIGWVIASCYDCNSGNTIFVFTTVYTPVDKIMHGPEHTAFKHHVMKAYKGREGKFSCMGST
jgi:hypothetical protein